MYVSLSEIQIKDEEEASNRPFTKVFNSRKIAKFYGVKLWLPKYFTKVLLRPQLNNQALLNGDTINGFIFLFDGRLVGAPVGHSL